MNKKSDVFSSGPGWSFLIDSASVVVLRVSRSGAILAANRQARTLIGDPLVGQPWHSILLNFNSVITLTDWLASEVRPRLLNVHTLAGLPQTLQVTVESDGADYLLFGEFNAGEQARLAREVLELNHELNNLTRELAINNVELAHLSALKNQFLGMAAHDLRKPTGLILAYAEFLIDEVASSLSVEHQDFLQTIHNAADRMRCVVDDFLDVSLIEAGRFDLDEQAVDLAQLVTAAVKLVAIAATKGGVKISVALDPSSQHVFVDGAKIEQVLTNLLSNAVENSSSGDCVTVTSQRLATELRVQVADNGPGMALAQQQGLFQAFASGQTGLKSSGERSIGLGLAIARKIVDAHGGRMSVLSAPGQGSVFGFTLPLTRSKAANLSTPAARPGQG
jgi:signal transduction histidine kinase